MKDVKDGSRTTFLKVQTLLDDTDYKSQSIHVTRCLPGNV